MPTMLMMVMGDDKDRARISHFNATDRSSPPQQAVFHEFLGSKSATLHSSSGFPPDSSPFEKQVVEFERSSSYGPRTDVSVSEISYQLVGRKRNVSDAIPMGSAREGFSQIIPESSHVMKMLCTANRERSRMPLYDGPAHGSHQNRPASASFMLQQTGGTYRNIANLDRSTNSNVGGDSNQYNVYAGKAPPVMYPLHSSRLKDVSSRPSVLSQLAADEGSRTGVKSSGILTSFDPGSSSLASERKFSALVHNDGIVKPATCKTEPDSSSPPRWLGQTSIRKQMTIIFGGQLHVFDDVHPNQADVIMALAGSNGGSWSTNLPNSSSREAANDIALARRHE